MGAGESGCGVMQPDVKSSGAAYSGVREWLRERMSLDASMLSGAGFESLVGERMAALRCGGEREYLDALERSEEEGERLAGAIAVPETWFFRYPPSFALLVDELVRKRAASGARLRMVSIGCATGEEPHGMAMAALHAGWPAEAVRIDAIDRSEAALERARAGEYGPFSIRHELPAWAVEFLEHRDDRILVRGDVRSMVNFVRADVVGSGILTEGGERDVVFCRNLMIYLNAGARAKLVASIEAALADMGLLFVGHAEQMLCVTRRLARVEWAHAFALRANRAGATVEREPERVRPEPVRTLPRAVPSVTPRPMRAMEPSPERGIEEARALADAGQTAESEELARLILARKGPSADVLELLGTLRQAQSDSAEARRLFEQALYLEPGRPASLVQLAVIHERRGDHAKAELLWDRVRRASLQGGAS